MQLDVHEIINQGEGAQAEFMISDERPDLEGVELASPINGSIRVVGTKEGVLVAGTLDTSIVLECDRCLRAFNRHMEVPLSAEFSDTPEDDQFPIDKHGVIDLAEPVRQEIEVHTPLRRLCQDDCGGIELKQNKDT